MKNLTNDIKPVLATLGCLGVAITSSIVGLPLTSAYGIAGKLVSDLLTGLSVNIASSNIEKISLKSLRQWWLNPGPDISNHDLFKALQQSLVLALEATEKSYLKLFEDQVPRSLRKEIREKIEALCKEIQNSFSETFRDSVSDSAIVAFEEGYDQRLYSSIETYLDLQRFEETGDDFFRFLKDNLPINVTAAFTEILKSSERVWIAYQRFLLVDIQQSNQRLEIITGEALDKLNVLTLQVQTLANISVHGGADQLKMLWTSFSEANVYFNQSLSKIAQHQQEFFVQLSRIEQDITEEIIQQRKYRQESSLSLRHIELMTEQIHRDLTLLKRTGHRESVSHSTLLQVSPQINRESNYNIEDLENNVLPIYLNWMVQHYQQIKLPAINKDKSSSTMPLERVYVALQLIDEKTREEFKSGQLLLKQQLRAEEAKSNRSLDDEEKSNIRAKVLQRNGMTTSFKRKYIENDKKLDSDTQVGVVSLAEVFQNERHLLILGDPGSGKSTLANWLALQLAQSMLRKNERVMVEYKQVYGNNSAQSGENNPGKIDLGPIRLPVLVKIPEYTKFFEEFKVNTSDAQIGQGIIDFCGCALHIPAIPGLEPRMVRQLIEYYLIKNEVVFILDGMDEVVKNRDKIIDEIEKLIQGWINLNGKNERLENPGKVGGNQIILTSRIVGYHAAPLRSEVKEVYVRQMDREAVESFCDLWTAQVYKSQFKNPESEKDKEQLLLLAQGLKDAIFDPVQPRIQELATNPLLITILALLYKTNQKLPKSRAELYEQSIKILVGKWNVVRADRPSISEVELNKLLEALAFNIHSSPSESISEPSMVELLEQELSELRNIGQTEPISILIKGQVLELVRIIKEDVGLLSEQGEKTFCFLHRTFQEYLAAKRLIDNEQTAIANIVDRLSDPIWREPVLLSIAYTYSYWPKEKFHKLIESLVSAEDQLKDLVPRGILLIASALPDMDKVEPELFKKIVQEFLEAFGNQKGIGRFKSIRNSIKTVIDNLRKSEREKEFFVACRELLAYPIYNDVQWALLHLAATDSWYKPEWIEHLLEHLEEDSPEWSWPIDLILLQEFASTKTPEIPASLVFRERLLQSEEYFKFVESDQDWQRLIMVLYGAWEYDPLIEKFKEYEKMRRLFAQKKVEMESEGYKMAVKLDTELGTVTHLRKKIFRFSPQYIHRESPFTRLLLRQIATKSKAKDLIPEFYRFWKEDTNLNTRALALLALASMGENVARIIYQITDSPDETGAAIHFLNHLKRVERNLSLPALRLLLDAKQLKELQKYGWHNLPVKESSYAWSILCRMYELFELPIKTAFPNSLQSSDGIYPDESTLRQDLIHREAESYGSLLNYSGEDSLYSVMVILDTAGKNLNVQNAQFIMDALCELPFTSNIKGKHNLGWTLPNVWFHPETEFEKLSFALRVIDGIPDSFYLLREYLTHCLWKRLQAYPDLKVLALSTFFNRKYGPLTKQLLSSLIEEFSQKNPGVEKKAWWQLGLFEKKVAQNTTLGEQLPSPIENDESWLDVVVEALVPSIQNPFIRFLTAFNISEQGGAGLSSEIALYQAFEEIKTPSDWINAYMMLQQRETWVFLLYKNEITGKKELAIVPKMIQHEQPEQAILAQIHQIPRVRNQIRAFIYAAQLVQEDQQKELVFSAMKRVPQIKDEEERAKILNFILERFQHVATHYPHWQQINASFTNEYSLNRALSKQYANLLALEKFIATGLEDTPLGTSMWSSFALMNMSQELNDRFKERDIDGALVQQIVNNQNRISALQEFIERNKNGLPINSRYVGLIDDLWAQKLEDEIRLILPLMELQDPGAGKWIQKWANSDNPDMRIFVDLAKAEAGVLDIQILQSLVTILKVYPDRLRIRAQLVIHGSYLSNNNPNRAYLSSNLSFEFLYYLSDIRLKERLTHPEVGSTLGWFMHNFIFDSPDMVKKFISIHLSGVPEQQYIVEHFLRSFERSTPEVVKELFENLTHIAPSTGWLLWKAIAILMYIDNSNFSRKKIVQLEDIEHALKSPNASEALMLLEQNTRFEEVSYIGKAILKLKDADQNSSLSELLDLTKTSLAQLNKPNFVDCKNNIIKIRNELIRVGEHYYYHTSQVEENCKNYSSAIGNDPVLLKVLIKWTFEELEEGLINPNKSGLMDGVLALLLGRHASDYPETFATLVNQKLALRILPETICFNPSYAARKGAIEMLAQLKIINSNVLEALVKAIKDVYIVRTKAIQVLPEFSEQVDRNTVNKLIAYMNSSSAEVANELAKLLSKISLQSALDVELRKLAINSIADLLRRQLKEPVQKKYLYRLSDDDPRITKYQAIIYEGQLEDTLFAELVRLTGI